MLDFEGIAEFFTLGFTLDDKTMLENVKISPQPFPHIEPKATCIEDLDQILEDAVEKCVKPHTALGLSGGIDSRLMAGYVARHDKNVLCYTFGYSDLERKIAAKVGSTLGLKHVQLYDHTFLTLEDCFSTMQFMKRIGGIQDFFNLYVKSFSDLALKNCYGVKNLLGGFEFEIICGSFSMRKSANLQDVINALLRYNVAPELYLKVVRANLEKACKGMSLREAIIHVYAKNNFKNLTNVGLLPYCRPEFEKSVLECVLGLDREQTILKRIQLYLLKRHFKKLDRIPYAKSLLRPSFPLIMHTIVEKASLRLSTGMMPCPFLTHDMKYFWRKNYRQLRQFVRKLPPFWDLGVKLSSMAKLLSFNSLLQESENYD
jgi:hypothetical protein